MQNFTPIDDLVQEYKAMKYGAGASIKEALPISTIESAPIDEQKEEDVENKNVNAYITPKKDESISLPPDLKKLGVQTPDTDDQFKAALYKIKLPVSDEKIMDDLKASPSESKRWFATLLVYILAQAHLTLKRIGTKVVRVFKTD
jgi:hypothetical protein